MTNIKQLNSQAIKLSVHLRKIRRELAKDPVLSQVKTMNKGAGTTEDSGVLAVLCEQVWPQGYSLYNRAILLRLARFRLCYHASKVLCVPNAT